MNAKQQRAAQWKEAANFVRFYESNRTANGERAAAEWSASHIGRLYERCNQLERAVRKLQGRSRRAGL